MCEHKFYCLGPAPVSWIKLNFWWCLKRQPGCLWCWVVLRVHKESILKAACKILPHGTNNVAEFSALLTRLSLAIIYQAKNLYIEGDSMVVHYLTQTLPRETHICLESMSFPVTIPGAICSVPPLQKQTLLLTSLQIELEMKRSPIKNLTI